MALNLFNMETRSEYEIENRMDFGAVKTIDEALNAIPSNRSLMIGDIIYFPAECYYGTGEKYKNTQYIYGLLKTSVGSFIPYKLSLKRTIGYDKETKERLNVDGDGDKKGGSFNFGIAKGLNPLVGYLETVKKNGCLVTLRAITTRKEQAYDNNVYVEGGLQDGLSYWLDVKATTSTTTEVKALHQRADEFANMIATFVGKEKREGSTDTE